MGAPVLYSLQLGSPPQSEESDTLTTLYRYSQRALPLRRHRAAAASAVAGSGSKGHGHHAAANTALCCRAIVLALRRLCPVARRTRRSGGARCLGGVAFRGQDTEQQLNGGFTE
jgi:hypothetical protein